MDSDLSPQEALALYGVSKKNDPEAPPQYLSETGKDGNVYSVENPEWKKYAQQKKYEWFLERSQIPADYHDLDFDSYPWDKSKPTVTKCRHFAENINDKRYEKVSLLLRGQNSSAKTTVACAIGKEAIRQGLKVSFILAGNLTNIFFKTSGFEADPFFQKQLESLVNSDIIIVDDAFDKRKAVLWESESKAMIIAMWDSFMRECLSKGRRFVITTNMSLADVGTSYGLSMYELIDRNFVQLEFLDVVKHVRRSKLDSVFDGISTEGED